MLNDGVPLQVTRLEDVKISSDYNNNQNWSSQRNYRQEFADMKDRDSKFGSQPGTPRGFNSQSSFATPRSKAQSSNNDSSNNLNVGAVNNNRRRKSSIFHPSRQPGFSSNILSRNQFPDSNLNGSRDDLSSKGVNPSLDNEDSLLSPLGKNVSLSNVRLLTLVILQRTMVPQQN